MYLRLFDVSIVETSNHEYPVAKLQFKTLPQGFEFVPVVYITAKTIQFTKDPENLGARIASLVQTRCSQHQLDFREIQIDCDWTEGTKDNYFRLLKSIKKQLPAKLLSCTIRLHQIKYPAKTGVPPVDRGMLMFYNMGKLEDPSRNSIYDDEITRKYSSFISSYALPLDAALPAFSWIVHYRNHRLTGLNDQLGAKDFKDHPKFKPLAKNRWICLESCFVKGEYFIKNDELKEEAVDFELCQKAANLLEGELKSEERTIALFSWDDYITNYYEEKDLERIYATFD